jgi:hypothetical protein
MRCNYPGKTGFYTINAVILILALFILDSPAQVTGWPPGRIITAIDSGYESSQEKINSTLLPEQIWQKKSVSKAFLYSLLVPGLGEAYTGHTGYTKFFLTVEAAGWGIYLASYWQVLSRMEDYKNFAVQHTGLDRSGKDAQYWINIGKYNTIYDYNEQKRRERNLAVIYTENTQNFWRWDSYNNRLYYDWKRIQAREIQREQVYIIAGLVFNHLLSAINALRLARIHNRHSDQIGWNIQVSINPYHHAALLNFCKTF